MKKYKTITNEKCSIAESPIWDYKKRILLWTDLMQGFLYWYCPETAEIVKFAENKKVCGFSLAKDGLFCACIDGLYFWDEEKGFRLFADYYNNELLKCNDAIADIKGRFLFGTVYYTQENCNGDYPLGKLYKVENDGSVCVLDEGFHHVNGLGFSPDNKTFYFTDTVLRVIYAYDYNVLNGTVMNRRVFAEVPGDEGIPDGLTVDAKGFVWSAQWYGGCIVRYDPDGKVERRVHLPVKQVSSLIFGGVDMTDIFITTAGKSVKLNIAPKGYDFYSPNIGGQVFKFNCGIEGKHENIADINYK
jgi:sugar lactone lactonase YvrE